MAKTTQKKKVREILLEPVIWRLAMWLLAKALARINTMAGETQDDGVEPLALTIDVESTPA